MLKIERETSINFPIPSEVSDIDTTLDEFCIVKEADSQEE